MTAVLQRVDREWLGREDEWKARMLLKAAVWEKVATEDDVHENNNCPQK